jgi:hypothetical protein
MTTANMKVYVLLGAYQRIFKDAREAVTEWWGGAAFLTLDGPTCTIKDVPDLLAKGYTHVQILDFEMQYTLALLYLGTLTDE